MSKLDWNFLFKPIVQKKNKKDDEQIKKTGIEIIEAPKLDENKKIYFILTNALINFLVVTGTTWFICKTFWYKMLYAGYMGGFADYCYIYGIFCIIICSLRLWDISYLSSIYIWYI